MKAPMRMIRSDGITNLIKNIIVLGLLDLKPQGPPPTSVESIDFKLAPFNDPNIKIMMTRKMREVSNGFNPPSSGLFKINDQLSIKRTSANIPIASPMKLILPLIKFILTDNDVLLNQKMSYRLEGMEHNLASKSIKFSPSLQNPENLASNLILHAKRDLDGTLFDSLIRTYKKIQALNNSKSEDKADV